MGATPLESGHITTNNNTPTGALKQVAVDNPYITKDDFIQTEYAIGLGIDSNSPLYTFGRLDKLILSASAQINRYCRRWFDTQTIDETKTGFYVRPFNPQLLTVVLQNRPYNVVNSVYIQVLKFFIQVDVLSSGYFQDFPDLGYYKIVPLLSSAGTGTGSPIPSYIIDRVSLGVLWTNYTFGYGTTLTAQSLTQPTGTTDLKQYQAPLGNRLWAPSQTINVYKNATLESTANYTLDYANGLVTFNTALASSDVVTADFVTNESLPFDIKQATALLVAHFIGQGISNPLGAQSYTMQTFTINWKEKSAVREEFERLLEPYQNNMPKII